MENNIPTEQQQPQAPAEDFIARRCREQNEYWQARPNAIQQADARRRANANPLLNTHGLDWRVGHFEP